MFAALKKQLWPDPEPWTEPKERPAWPNFGNTVKIAGSHRPAAEDGNGAREALAENAKKRASLVADLAKIERKILEISDAGRVDENLGPNDAMSADAMAAALADPASFDLSQVQNRFADRLAEAANARAIGAPVIAGLAAQARELHAEHRRLTEEGRRLVDSVILAEGAKLMAEAREAGQAIDDRLAALDGLISHARGAGNGTLVSALMAQRRMYPTERDARRNRSAGIVAKWRRWASLRLPNDPNAIEDLPQ